MAMTERDYAPLALLLETWPSSAFDETIAPLNRPMLAAIVRSLPKHMLSSGVSVPGVLSNEQVKDIAKSILESPVMDSLLLSVLGANAVNTQMETVKTIMVNCTMLAWTDEGSIMKVLESLPLAAIGIKESHQSLLVAFMRMASIFRAGSDHVIRCGQDAVVKTRSVTVEDVRATISRPIAAYVCEAMGPEHFPLIRYLEEAISLACYARGGFSMEAVSVADSAGFDVQGDDAQIILLCLFNDEIDFVLDRYATDCLQLRALHAIILAVRGQLQCAKVGTGFVIIPVFSCYIAFEDTSIPDRICYSAVLSTSLLGHRHLSILPMHWFIAHTFLDHSPADARNYPAQSPLPLPLPLLLLTT